MPASETPVGVAALQSSDKEKSNILNPFSDQPFFRTLTQPPPGRLKRITSAHTQHTPAATLGSSSCHSKLVATPRGGAACRSSNSCAN
ncbi:hypothetical protein NPIL_494731 [Nephila pilipes]|uniref:Uncharacterized protein n=1 Tax=Nephila pilipes TaxID=299642 RepID=A0A8X6T7A3_NEPPI|nr:hypothetical protein NPIL_494731 [Nephila pilipes]